MPGAEDLFYKLGVSFSNPAEDKECGMLPVTLEEVKNLMSILFNPRWIAIPGITADSRRQSGDLEMLFDIETKDILHHSPADETGGFYSRGR
jgi:hypothetical protein